MITLILTIHIIALTTSIFATTIMIISTLLSRATPKLAQRANLFITSIGIALGTILLINHPVGSRCVELTAYLVIFVLAYRFIAARSAQPSKPITDTTASR